MFAEERGAVLILTEDYVGDLDMSEFLRLVQFCDPQVLHNLCHLSSESEHFHTLDGSHYLCRRPDSFLYGLHPLSLSGPDQFGNLG